MSKKIQHKPRISTSKKRARRGVKIMGSSALDKNIRAYEKIEDKLGAVGADIERIRDSVTGPLSTSRSQESEARSQNG